MAKHTPTPWAHDDGGNFKDVSLCITRVHYGANDHQLICMKPDNNPNWGHDAEFIVRACNAHEALLMAAKHAAISISETITTLGRKPEEAMADDMPLGRLLAAIKLAEGK